MSSSIRIRKPTGDSTRLALWLWRRENVQFHFAVGFASLHSERTLPTFRALPDTLATSACVFLHSDRALPALRASHQRVPQTFSFHGVAPRAVCSSIGKYTLF